MGGSEEEEHGAKKAEFQGKPGLCSRTTQSVWAIRGEQKSPAEISHRLRPCASYPDRSFTVSTPGHRLAGGLPRAVSKLLAWVLRISLS